LLLCWIYQKQRQIYRRELLAFYQYSSFHLPIFFNWDYCRYNEEHRPETSKCCFPIWVKAFVGATFSNTTNVSEVINRIYKSYTITKNPEDRPLLIYDVIL
jgi:hypothetical protein